MGDYEVGYKKPPKHTQFKKGKSGNPGEKRKSTANIVTALEKVLNARVTIRLEGKIRSVTRLEAALQRLAAKATAGDTSAFRLLSILMQAYPEPEQLSSNPDSELQAADQKILHKLLSHFGTTEKGDAKA